MEKPFVAEIWPELDEAVDGLLARLEAGEGKRAGKEVLALHRRHPNYHMTNYAMGLSLFKDTLRKQPNHVQSYGNMGLAYAGLGKRSEALACYDRALELDPDYEPAILNRRVTSQMREGEPFEAWDFKNVEYYSDRVRDQNRQKTQPSI